MGPITSWQLKGGKMKVATYFIFLGSRITADGDCSHETRIALWKENYDKPRLCIKKQRHHFANKGLYSQSYAFSSGHVQIRELDHKEGWVPKSWYFHIVVLEKTLESPMYCKKIKPINPKEIHPWMFIGRADVEAEVPIL